MPPDQRPVSSEAATFRDLLASRGSPTRPGLEPPPPRPPGPPPARGRPPTPRHSRVPLRSHSAAVPANFQTFDTNPILHGESTRANELVSREGRPLATLPPLGLEAAAGPGGECAGSFLPAAAGAWGVRSGPGRSRLSAARGLGSQASLWGWSSVIPILAGGVRPEAGEEPGVALSGGCPRSGVN